MLPFNPDKRCDGITRRDFLHLGFLTALGVSSADLLRLEAALPANKKKATSCILIWLDGGPSHLDTFDPKPDAPREVRSQFNTVPTTIPGVHLCEHLPLTAKCMNEIALIRSLTHELGNHDTGARFMLTGHKPNPAMEFPSLGSLVAKELGSGTALPPYLAIPNDSVGGDSGAARSGYLQGAWSAFNVGENPAKVRDLHAPEGISFSREQNRREALLKMDEFNRTVESSNLLIKRDAFYEQAYRLISSPEAKSAFNIDREAQKTIDRYGRSKIGSGCLLARRLVEAGARFATVVDTGWDTHNQIFRELPDSRFPGSGKLPNLDRAYSALLSDLKQRGLLESTLVVLMGEFGRTPKLNAQGGRDHWPRAGFVCMAGGGVKGGQVIGATNEFGELPAARPVTPPDVAWSILQLLGIDPMKELRTPTGRPMRILNEGAFISELV